MTMTTMVNHEFDIFADMRHEKHLYKNSQSAFTCRSVRCMQISRIKLTISQGYNLNFASQGSDFCFRFFRARKISF